MTLGKKLLAPFAALLLSVGALGSIVVPAAYAAPGDRCYSDGYRKLNNGGQALVPQAGNGVYNCWLAKNVNYENIAVSRLQYGLNGGESYSLQVDGVFGGQTEYAVWNTQRGRGVAMDGVYGLNTAKAMFWYVPILGRAKWGI